MAKDGFTRAELGLVGTAALLVFSRVFGLSIVLPNFRDHYGSAFTVDPIWIGVAFSAYGLTMALMQFPNGVLSDRFGRKPLLWSASLFFVGGALLSAFATTPALLIAGRLLQGMGAVASVAVAAVGETLPPRRRTMGMALVGIPAGTGFLFGMAAGPLLYPLISMQGLFLLVAAMGAFAALPLLGIRMPDRSPDLAGASPRPVTRGVLALAFGGFATNYVMTTTLFFLPDFATQVLHILMAVALVSILLLSRAIDKAGWTWQPLFVGLAFVGASSALFILVPGLGFWIGGALFFTFHSVLATVLPSQVSRIAGPSGGRGHGLQNVIAYGGTFLAGPIAGALVGRADVAIGVATTFAVVAGVAIAWTLRTPQPSSVGSGEPTPRE